MTAVAAFCAAAELALSAAALLSRACPLRRAAITAATPAIVAGIVVIKATSTVAVSDIYLDFAAVLLDHIRNANGRTK